ncbi:MAG: hypothetical protein WCF68_15480 [Terriglobales bacterium]
MLLFMCVMAVSRAGVCADAPTKMIHAIVQMSGTNISAESFAAKPKTFWRASNQYCRVDEEPDPANGIHGRLVVNEPDAWLINLADQTAKHVLDKGPTFNCKLPIFAFDAETVKSKLGELEIGRELDFFHANSAKLIDGPKLEFEARYYELKVADSVLRLVERVDIHAPILISMVKGDKAYEVRYLLWTEVPFKADLFASPTGVKIEEAK